MLIPSERERERRGIKGEEKITKNLIPENTISYIKKLSSNCEKYENEANKRVDRAIKLKQGDQLSINLLHSNFNMHLRYVYNFLDIAMSSINELNGLIEKGATKDEIKRVQTDISNKVNETLVPIKKGIEEQKQRQKRASTIYG
jgi:hypothetical protein